ncbi:MAG TPA: TonB-dependent receptor [Vicinamibacterales bacterium]|nr:TonB-dependent receptor [Vicinamibacterales bacterium]
MAAFSPARVFAQRPAASTTSTASSGAAVTGVVLDQTGGVLIGVLVELVNSSRTTVQTGVTDQSGTFRFEHVAAGSYDVRSTLEGFKPTTARVNVGTSSPKALRVTLPLAAVTQEVTVSNFTEQVSTAAANNLDAVTLDQEMLGNLPMLDQDYIGMVSRFLDAGALGTGGPTIVVNGMEVSSLNVTASAVQQIKINQDPYSAEYSRPGRGRIEILTKPGGQEYEGELNLTGRAPQFNARNAFAPTRSTEQRQIVEGTLSGPVGGSGKTSFLVSVDGDAQNQQATVLATTLDGRVISSVTQPNRHLELNGSITHQFSKSTTISIRPSYEDLTQKNRGIGGTTLASAGTNFAHREEQITYTQQTIFSPTLVNQFQFLTGHEREPTTSVSPAQGIVVAGAFTGGGAQGDVTRTERHFQLTESLGWTTTNHFVQWGLQVPDWSRRGFEDRSNVGGTFYFSSLDAYARGQPYAFIQQQGNGTIAPVEKLIGTYVKDDWRIGKQLTASFGLRYDWQDYVTDHDNFAPRFSFAYAPGGGKANVIRGGAGYFYDRTGPVAIADTLQYRPGGLRRVVLTNPSYPDPFAGGGLDSQPPSVVQFAPGMQIPHSVQYSLGFEHQLQKATTVSVTYTGARGYDLFRSRDINAPLPSSGYLVRPDLNVGVIRQIESAGRQRTNSLQLMLRGRITRWFSGQTQYSYARAYNDTNGISWFPANDYDLSGEWARADFDRRHRFVLLGRVSATKLFDVGLGVTLLSGAPYSETLGLDLYNNGRGSARPAGVGRNTLQGSGSANVDVRLSRDLKLGGKAQSKSMTIALDVFNALNRVNFINYQGTVTSPFFGRPLGASAPRQLQLSARVKF